MSFYTLNMSMLRHFFEKPLDGLSSLHLFEGLKVAQKFDPAEQQPMEHQGQSPG